MDGYGERLTVWEKDIYETFLGEKRPEEGPDPKEKLSIVLRAAKILAGSSERSNTLTCMIEKYEKIVSSVAKLLEACDRVEEVERTNLLIQKQTDLLDLSNRDIICTPTQNKKGKSENETITSTERVRLKHLERTRRDAEREALEKIREHEDEIKLGHRLRRMERNVVETEEQFKIEKARWFPHHPVSTHSIISPTTISPRSAELSAPMMVSPMTEISSSSSVMYTPTTAEESMTTPPILSYRVQSTSSPFVPPSLISPSSMITPSSNLSTPSLMTSRVTCVDDLDENEMNTSTSVVFSPLDRLMKISRNTATVTPSNAVEQQTIQASEVEIEKVEKEKQDTQYESITISGCDLIAVQKANVTW